jgi:UDP-N-acetylmuramoyl-tripeptide--D-alanyl-D-alanine ligase
MRKSAISFLERVLAALTKTTVKRYKPRIIGVTGSVGKTSTKTAIFTVLDKATDKKVRAPGGNLNNELGLPLAILGDYETSRGALFWLGVVLRATLRLIFIRSSKKYPDVIILEYGADKPGDIKRLVRLVRPDVAVVTAVGNVPVHVEYYSSPEEVAREKEKLIENMGAGGIAVLNIDDPAVYDMRENAKTQVITFGTDSSADVRITEAKNISKNGEPFGLFLKLAAEKNHASVTMDGVFGKSQAHAAAAACAVGLIEGLKLAKIAEALALYEGEKGKTKLIPGIKDSFILDDTYNAAPLSSAAALDIVDELDAKRKVAALGDMLELGKYTESEHINLGRYAARVLDYLITVGTRAKFIAEGAVEAGMEKKNIESFDTSEEAKERVQELVKEGDLVLVKGSQSMRMEKIVLEIMAEPERAKDLLVRQYGKWLKS